MESIEKYNVLRVKRVEMTKEEEMASLEREMYYLLEENMELERILREAKEAEKKLKRNKERLIELAVQYASMEGDM